MRCSGSWAVMPAKGCDALVQQFGDSARMSLDAQSFLPRLYCVSCEGECHAVGSLYWGGDQRLCRGIFNNLLPIIYTNTFMVNWIEAAVRCSLPKLTAVGNPTLYL